MVATLYYTPTSCGVASFIAAHKIGLIGTKLNAYEADIRNKKVLTGPNTGADFFAINPKGNVPTIVLDDGSVLNENAATLQWIADQDPTHQLGAAYGTSARYLLQAKLSYVSSELHSTVGNLFNPACAGETREYIINKYKTKLEFLNNVELKNAKPFLLGEHFTVADSYLYVVLSWSGYLGLDLTPYAAVKAYYDHVDSLDFIKAARAAATAASPKN